MGSKESIESNYESESTSVWHMQYKNESWSDYDK